MAGAIRVKGYREFVRACNKSTKEVKTGLRKRLRDAGRLVQEEARSLFSRYDAGSASGFRVRVRQRGVAVEQSNRRVTGKRPDYGALQMREALIPGRAKRMPEVERELERILDDVSHNF